jgi:protein-S-isoprenylcysteine O-methyltransferase Ste14
MSSLKELDMNWLELRIPPVPLAVLFGAVMWLVAWLSPALRIALPGTGIATLVLCVSGGLFGLAGVIMFRLARTTPNPVRPSTASTIVTTGVYGLSRNPMYTGLLLALSGWAAHLSNPLVLVFLPLFVVYMNRFQIIPEERALSAKFGDDYAKYTRTVRRWI